MNRFEQLSEKILVGLTLLAFGAMPLTGLAGEPKALSPKPKQTQKVATPDTIKAGGKSLSQWRAIFGTGKKSSDALTIANVPITRSTITTNLAPHSTSSRSRPPKSEGRRTVERIVRDAQKVYWSKLAVIANNLANADTVAFKRNHTLLEGAEFRVDRRGNLEELLGQMAMAAITATVSVPILNVQADFSQGRLLKTGRMLDIAIEGKGFLQAKDQQTGEILYTRAGNLSIDSHGRLSVGHGKEECRKKGLLVEPGITIPKGTSSVSISPGGIVSAKIPGSRQMSQIGRIQLACFINPEGLQRLGGKFFGETDVSGTLICGEPGQDSFGVIRQGHLEGSNVSVDDELKDQRETAKRIQTLGRALPK